MENKVYRNGRTLFLSGCIDSESSGEVIANLLYLIAEDEKQDNEKKEYTREDINLYIKSNGGNVTDMFGIIDLINSSKTPINTYAIGNIASAAVPLFISGKKRFVYKNTEIMIHTLSGGLRDKIQGMHEYLLNAEESQKMIDNYILQKTNITKDKLKEVREKKLDWYLYADEAIKLGIADEII